MSFLDGGASSATYECIVVPCVMHAGIREVLRCCSASAILHCVLTRQTERNGLIEHMAGITKTIDFKN